MRFVLVCDDIREPQLLRALSWGMVSVLSRQEADCEQVARRLSREDRAVHDERQRKIDAAGQDAWEPGKEAEAAGRFAEATGFFDAALAILTEMATFTEAGISTGVAQAR